MAISLLFYENVSVSDVKKTLYSLFWDKNECPMIISV